MQTVAVLQGVSKRYRRNWALRGFSASFEPGEIVGLLGPNGAGKSTLMRLLTGLVRPTEGTIEVLGVPMPVGRGRVLHRVGALIEDPAFYEHLSALENLRILAGYYPRVPRDRCLEVLELVGLSRRAPDPVQTYSVGMKRRLGLAAALLPAPEFLILDEPASGLDPEAILQVQQILRDQASRGVCVLLSSHLLGEVARVCHRVLVLRQGRLVGEGPAGGREPEWTEVRVDDPARACSILERRIGAGGMRCDGHTLLIRTELLRPSEVVRILTQADLAVDYVAPHQPSIEDYYFELVREEAEIEGEEAVQR